MNFGAFAGGLANGISTGMKLASSMRGMIKEQGMQDMGAEGMANAEADRAAQVSSMVVDNTKQAPPPETAAPAPEPAPVSSVAPPTPAPATVPRPQMSAPPAPGAPPAEGQYWWNSNR